MGYGITIVSNNTNSMYPEFSEDRNTITVINKNYDNIEVGDIIEYEDRHKYFNSNNNIVHRVVGITEYKNTTYYITQGDNNNHTDPYVSEDQVVGVVVWHY